MPRAALNLLAVLLIVATLAQKLRVQDTTVDEDLSAAIPGLKARLAGQGYAATQPRVELPRVVAAKAGCAATIRLIDAHGTYRDTELLKVPRGWTPRYAWRGAWYASLPRAAPLFDYYAARELARLGRPYQRSAVAMAYARPGCPLPSPSLLAVAVPIRSAPRL